MTITNDIRGNTACFEFVFDYVVNFTFVFEDNLVLILKYASENYPDVKDLRMFSDWKYPLYFNNWDVSFSSSALLIALILRYLRSICLTIDYAVLRFRILQCSYLIG